MNTKLIKVFIDEKPCKVPLGYTIMQSCVQAGIDVPRFCYHDKLLIAGNCRICLVELTGSKKLLASCAVHISKNAFVYTNTARVKLARQNVLEFLLANHPLDCPICDQGGECDLQDITAIFGADRGRFYESEKRAVLNKDFGPLIRTSMNRCIHCTRCVRFMSLSAGMSVLGTLGRGASTEIGSYVGKFLFDELSGNITDLCPVGALTSKPYSFKARPWELVSVEGLDTFDALNANLLIDIAANKICRILPYANEFINEGWLTNRARYAYDGLFFQRLNSCLLQVSSLQTFDFLYNRVVRRLTSFFIKLSWDAAVSLFLVKLFCGNMNYFVADTGASTDIEAVFGSFETVSLLGGNIISPLSSVFNNICDFRSIFTFNLTLSELAKIPSFCFFLGSNPRFEAPLLNLKLTKLQQDFAVPFYRIGASVHYYSYPVTFISNSIRVFFEICEFKHIFCKRFYVKTFSVCPLFFISGAVLNSVSGGVSLVAVFSLLKRLTTFSSSASRDVFGVMTEFSFFNILGLYSG
jgi:NADH-quinone oxidoreductase chain G